MSAQAFLFLLALIFLALSAVGVNPPRVHFGWLGLAVALFAAELYPLLVH